nr:PocR ligand-binding domain-containing protein [uncultured Desulfobacter sp.]
MDNFRLYDLVDLSAVQKMAESHFQSTGMPIGIIDAFDNSILVGVGWQDICLNFHRINSESAKRCHASDNFIKQNLRIGEACKYKCKNGLWDIGIPIVVQKVHLATLFIGQFFYDGEIPDKAFFIEQSNLFGYDRVEYLKALERVPIFKHEKVEYILDYDKALATFLMDLAEKSLSQKKADNELHKAQAYLSNVINSMPSILIGIDSDEKITQWNRNAELTTGLSFADVVSKSFRTIFPSLKNELPDIRNVLKNNQIIRHNKRTLTDKNATRYVDITMFPIIDEHTKGAVIRIDDATERVRVERMMLQSEKMLSIGGLAAGMAHEINNPLASIMHSAYVMKNRLEDIDMPANLRVAKELGISMVDIRSFMEKRNIFRMLSAMHESGSRAAEIVNNMLSFARKSESKFSFHYPNELVDKILDLATTDYDLKKQYDFKSIEIRKQYEDNLPALLCESGEIQQVLLNIFRNGAQAMQSAKTKHPQFIIRIYTEKVPNSVVSLEIEDNGPGMDADTCSKVFDPFFTTKPVGVGTGLGLSVSYFIITENHKGRMEVISEPGKGATFIIRLPTHIKNQ